MLLQMIWIKSTHTTMEDCMCPSPLCQSVRNDMTGFQNEGQRLIEIFRLEFYRIYRIYRICRKLFLAVLKMTITKNSFLQIL